MKVLYKDNFLGTKKETVIGLGNFDGVHKAHMAIVDRVILEAKSNNLESLLYTFREHPQNVISDSKQTLIITSLEDKLDILEETGLDSIYLEDFTKEFLKTPAEVFIKSILVDKFKMKSVVVGYNYRYGHKGLGDISLLKKLGIKYDFTVIIIPQIMEDQQIISSTLIRNLILSGSIKEANRILGREFFITGLVVKGAKVGRSLGFPTANLMLEDYMLRPNDGVYEGECVVNGQNHHALISIGNKPTFEGFHYSLIEAYLFDFDEDIYGEEIKVFFLNKLRNQIKFDSAKDLIIQMKKDVLSVKNRRN